MDLLFWGGRKGAKNVMGGEKGTVPYNGERENRGVDIILVVFSDFRVIRGIEISIGRVG